MSEERFDAVVIGAGPGGYPTAIRLGQLKVKTAIVEREYMGGVCLNVGCIPSKAVIHAAKTFEKIGHADTLGISVGKPTLDMTKLQAWKGGVVGKLTSGVRTLLKGNGVTIFDGSARLEKSGPDGHRVVVTSSKGTQTLIAKHVVLATGSRPFEIPGFKTDQKRILDSTGALALDHVPARMVVIGGGYIGLEAAAVLTKLGKKVTVLEVQERVLARVAGETLSRFYEAEHRAHGVDVRLGVSVDRIEGAAGRVSGVRLADGTVLPAQMVIVGIGIVPAVGPLLDAGLKDANGVNVDAYCRTGLPDVFAIGDCAAHVNKYALSSAPIRLESVQNASDQAKVAAKCILGQPEAYDAIPWFWSDQYDLKLQTVGLSTGYDSIVVRGDPAARSFTVVYLKDGGVIALDCVNAVKDYVQGKGLVKGRVKADPAALANPEVLLKSLVPPAAPAA